MGVRFSGIVRDKIEPGYRNYCSITVAGRRRRNLALNMELQSRENPIVTKLEKDELKKIFTPEVLDLKKLFDKYHYEIRIAGGAVRDLLMGQQPKDLDFATTATPDQMKEMFNKEEIRMINMNGEKHGTITPRINDKENFEVTTLRVDVVTDGRHADVEFTTDWKLDANRRDLTINSMFLGFDGSVYDYFFGYEDIKKRRVAFVGDPDIRIKEDYLRILRYFRFYGRIAEKPDNHEENTLKVIKDNVEGLKQVSGERIWMELRKTLQGNFPGNLLRTIVECGINKYIGLPSEPNLQELEAVMKRAGHLNLHPTSYLAALVRDLDEVTVLHSRLKFSNTDRDMMYHTVEHREDKNGARPLLPYEKLVIYTRYKPNDAVEYVREVLKYRGDETLLKQYNEWTENIPRFPVGGKELRANGVPSGKSYGLILKKLKEMWVDSDYKLAKEDLIKAIPVLVEDAKLKT